MNIETKTTVAYQVVKAATVAVEAKERMVRREMRRAISRELFVKEFDMTERDLRRLLVPVFQDQIRSMVGKLRGMAGKVVLGLDEKGGPGSGSWNGPGDPRFARGDAVDTGQRPLSSRIPRTENEKGLATMMDQFLSMSREGSGTSDWKYRGPYDLVSKEGVFDTPAPRPKGVAKGKDKECYMNAYHLATRNPEKYTYVEGFAFPDVAPIPMEHAWCVDKDGTVVDPTWPKPGTAYRGVHLSKEFIESHAAKTGYYGVFGYMGGENAWALMREGLPVGAKVKSMVLGPDEKPLTQEEIDRIIQEYSSEQTPLEEEDKPKEDKATSPSASSLVKKIFDPTEWKSRIIDQILPLMAVRMAEAAAGELISAGVDIRKKGMRKVSGEKFNPNHDESGRFATGGDGGGGAGLSYDAAPHISKEKVDVVKRIVSDLSGKYDLSVLKRVRIGTQDVGFVHGSISDDLSTMKLNANTSVMEVPLKVNHPGMAGQEMIETVSQNSLAGTVRHEIGHLVYESVSVESRKMWGSTVRRLEKTDPLFFMKHLSRFAGNAKSHKYHNSEVFSEAFAAYNHPEYKAGELDQRIEASLLTALLDVRKKGMRKVSGEKFNPFHDDQGRFSSGGGVGGAMAPDTGGAFGSGSTAARLARAVRRGGKWVLADGSSLPDHIPKNIPPKWRKVQVNLDPKANRIVIARDKKNNIQSLYSENHATQKAAVKFSCVNELRSKIRTIEREVERDSNSKNQTLRDRASCLRLIIATGIRPGSRADTGAEKKAYGATTLLGKHVVKENGEVRVRFPGKKGVLIGQPVRNPKVARDLLARKKRVGDNGTIFDTDAGKVLRYSKERDGGGFMSKDFRTAEGTNLAIKLIKSIKTPTNFKEHKAAVKEICEGVSARLGNGPQVAFKSYIDPAVWSKWPTFEDPKKKKSFESEKFNPYHDEQGRFSSGGGVFAMAPDTGGGTGGGVSGSDDWMEELEHLGGLLDSDTLLPGHEAYSLEEDRRLPDDKDLEYYDRHKVWMGSLSKRENEALKAYTGNMHFDKIRRCQNLGDCDEQTKRWSKDIQSALKRAPVYEGVVYRGLSFETKKEQAKFLATLKRDGELNDRGILSTTRSFITGDIYARSMKDDEVERGVLLRIVSKSGVELREVSEVGMAEHEVLFKAGMKFDVLGIRRPPIEEYYSKYKKSDAKWLKTPYLVTLRERT